jgi:amidase
MGRVHAFSDDALGNLDAVGLVEALRSGAVSVREVIDASIARVERLQPDLNAVAYTAYDRARAEARHPRGGYFAGIPTLVKDNSDVAGMPTCQGTDAWVGRPAQKDGDFARMYLATGLVPLGKSRLSEYGFSAAAEHPRLGPVRNPWDTDRTAGASSSGAGALVAGGAVPIAHANDGGGSIRIPASVNGLVGLKPTRGRLAQDALLRQQPVPIVADGVLTRSVRDTAAFFREAEKVYRDVRLPPIGDITRPLRKRLRIGVNTTSLEHPADTELTELTQKTVRILEELGHTVEEFPSPVPETFPDDFLLYWAMTAFVLLGTGRRLHGRTFERARHDDLTLGLAAHARRNLHRLPRAIRRLKGTAAVTERVFGEYDAVLTPTLGHGTPRIGHLDPTQDYDVLMERLLSWVTFTPVQNVSGDPAISLPLASDGIGLPVGLLCGAGAGREALLLELAYELEEAVPFPRIVG